MLIEDTVRYEASSPWPGGASGTDLSITRLSAAVHGDDPANWTASSASPGTHADLVEEDYPAWSVRNGLGDGPESLPDADFDQDGLANLVEFALLTNPRSHIPSDSPVVDVAELALDGQPPAGFLTLRFRRRIATALVIYSVEVSGDLVNWKQVNAEVGTAGNNGDGTESVTIRDDKAQEVSSERFIRLRVTVR